jgi:hypothetical protein
LESQAIARSILADKLGQSRRSGYNAANRIITTAMLQRGLLSGIFFWAYLLFEVPSNLMLRGHWEKGVY